MVRLCIDQAKQQEISHVTRALEVSRLQGDLEHSKKLLGESITTNKGLLELSKKLADENSNLHRVRDDDMETVENLCKELVISEKGNQTLVNNLKELEKELEAQKQMIGDLEASVSSRFCSLFSKDAEVLNHLGLSLLRS